MLETKMYAVIYQKGKIYGGSCQPKKIEVMRLQYKIEDNVLWITDHRGSIMDFDLGDYDVEITSCLHETKNNSNSGSVKKEEHPNWCIFEKKVCSFAKKDGYAFCCNAPSDETMPCH